jgi:hypothetical protein
MATDGGFALDPGDDFAIFDRPETVTYRVYVSGGTFTNNTGLSVIRRVLQRMDADMVPGMMSQGTTTFTFPGSALSSVTPKPKDRVKEADNTEWVVNVVEQVTLAARWRLTCTRAAQGTPTPYVAPSHVILTIGDSGGDNPLVTCAAPHGLTAGATVTVSGSSVSAYNGVFVIDPTGFLSTQFLLTLTQYVGDATGGHWA